MEQISVGELVKRAKGDDRSLREYARDSGVDAAIISKIINGTYTPKKPGIYESLTSPQASPRAGITYQQLMEAAGTSEEYRRGMSAGMSVGVQSTLSEIPSSDLVKALLSRGISVDGREARDASSATLKPEEITKIQHLRSETHRFAATANGIILGSLGGLGLAFQIVQTDGVELSGVRFDTYVKLQNDEISEYLIRYTFISEQEALCLPLVKNTIRRMVEELVFLPPSTNRKVSIVTNNPDAYGELCGFDGQLSYNGELSVILFDLEKATLLKEQYISHCLAENPVEEILLA